MERRADIPSVTFSPDSEGTQKTRRAGKINKFNVNILIKSIWKKQSYDEQNCTASDALTYGVDENTRQDEIEDVEQWSPAYSVNRSMKLGQRWMEQQD